MDYKEKYEKALERAREFQKSKDGLCVLTAESIFPELKESEDEKIRKALIFYLGDMPEDTELRNGVTNRDVLVWLEKQGDKDKLIQELGKYKVKYTQEVLEKHINSISNKDDERLRKTTIAFLKDFADKGYENAVECIDWLEEQGEQKVPINDFKAKDWYVSNVDGKIHDMTYNPTDNAEKKEETKSKQETLDNQYVEYVYILDYSTGRVIVAKHDVEESISELFEQLGLKENQCHYMVSDKILSIEYINF